MERSNASILIVDDEPAIVRAVSMIVRMEGYAPVSCDNMDDAMRLLVETDPRLVILDMRLPSTDGLAICRAIRSQSSIPIMMLTVCDDQRTAAGALNAGADDYMRKPFGADELIARVHALMRRRGNYSLGEQCLRAGSLLIDGRNSVASVDGIELVLTRTELALLAYMAENADRVLTHSQLLTAVWSEQHAESHHLLRVNMSRVRRKLAEVGGPLVETLTGVGYRLSTIDRKGRKAEEESPHPGVATADHPTRS